jgi:hypothetical protein
MTKIPMIETSLLKPFVGTFEHWNLFGVWDLEFGASVSFKA